MFQVRSFDYRSSQRTRWKLEAEGSSLLRAQADSDGTTGRARIVVERDGEDVLVRGSLLSGDEATVKHRWSTSAILGPDRMLASWVAISPRLAALAVGAETSLEMGILRFGSAAEIEDTPVHVTRLADELLPNRATPARAFEIAPRVGRKSRLWLDERGWPIRYEVEAYGSTVRYDRVE